jgi:Zn-dependent peptidase ImmA (M78 family)
MASKTEIEAKARQTLLDHGLYSVPVNPIIVAHKLGVRPSHAVFSEPKYSGLTARRRDGQAVILIKDSDSLVRKRFTVAHELGHLILHLGSGPNEIIDTEGDFFRTSDAPAPTWNPERRREYEANAFAAELLMPRELIISSWNALSGPGRTIARMAGMFQVSEEAMGYRLEDLELV